MHSGKRRTVFPGTIPPDAHMHYPTMVPLLGQPWGAYKRAWKIGVEKKVTVAYNEDRSETLFTAKTLDAGSEQHRIFAACQGQLKHRNLAPIHEIFASESSFFLISPFYSITLESINACPRFPMEYHLDESDRAHNVPVDDAGKMQGSLPGLQIVAVNYQGNNGSRASVPAANDDSPLMSSPTVWESPLKQTSNLHDPFFNLLPTNKDDLQFKIQKPADALQSDKDKVDSKVLDITQLAAFADAFKDLQARVQEDQLEAEQAKRDAQQANAELHDLRSKLLDSEKGTKDLRKQLDKIMAESAAACERLRYDLSREQTKARGMSQAHEATRSQLEAVQAEKRELERRLATAEQNRASKQKMASLEADLKTTQAENKGMKARIQGLESELQAEKAAFGDYKRKIRNLTADC
ncbi:hypothetical protein BU23DRAFT_603712 [Bimuria novae-zelandiae CBS 107.79]|uniref:Protein kinase domain-containing protein n=1 Tax=Bimuria novae-zelandiae CBS 107.79 TaxID=1447943 RepID=A0A6A5UMQ8_9PLEO|nr:hypothetical protein BU23DRAFT_603712 [Bimuria novae-zelandiae CBS 107.79]